MILWVSKCERSKFVKVFRKLPLRFAVLISLISLWVTDLRAQPYGLKLQNTGADSALLRNLLQPPESFATAEAAFSYIQHIVPDLQEQGFLAASIDSLYLGDKEYILNIFLGRRYTWVQLDMSNIPDAAISQPQMARTRWAGRRLRPAELAVMSEALLEWAENSGYPFAKVWLEAVKVHGDGSVEGKLMLDRAELQHIDSVRINGDVKISRSFLLRYLGLNDHDLYNEGKLRDISPRLRELPFLEERAPWSFAFKLGQNTLDLYLREKKSNQINALVGLQPNSAETGRLLLTVDALFAFQNILGQGERLSLTYQNLQYKSPRLQADVVYPYIFNTPVGLDAHFELFKKDTSFRRTNFQAGLRYLLSAKDYVRVFFQNQSNRLITIDTAFVKSRKVLPDNIDATANGAGIELELNRTDYRFNPRRGWQLQMGVSALIRRVQPADAITGLRDGSGFDYGSLYDSLKERQYQYILKGSLANHWPLGKHFVFKAGYSGAWITGKSLFRNELFQIGGFRLLRGFDEQSIFTDQYHILALELRVLLDNNSYVYLFSDNGYVETNFSNFHNSDFYNGFGIGTTLQSKSGVFAISYALGRNSANPIQFRQSKVHFGYIAFF